MSEPSATWSIRGLHAAIPTWARWFASGLLAQIAAVSLWWLIVDALPKTAPAIGLVRLLGIVTAFHVVTFVSVLACKMALAARREHLAAASSIASDEFSRLSAVVSRLRGRAVALRRAANVALLLILVALAGGLALFYFAKRISGDSYTEILAALRDSSRHDEQTLSRIRSAVRNVEQLAFMGLRELPQAQRAAAAASVQTDTKTALEVLTSEATTVKTAVDDIKKQLLALDRSDQTRDLISTIATRVGAVLLLVFLIQILVTLYRYNTRLAAYYEARADALELSIASDGHLNVDMFEATAVILSADRIDFGREPKSPVENGVELAKAVLSAAAGQRDKTQTVRREPGA
jgi:hypothetical protein